MSEEENINDLAASAIARLYQEFVVDDSLSHKEVSRVTSFLIAAFFSEQIHLGTQWGAIKNALDSHNAQELFATGSSIDGLAAPEFTPALITDATWSCIDACRKVAWSDVSPLIFGSAFQGVLEMGSKEVTDELSHGGGKRREFGAHYTSEENIMKVIGPLFLDSLVERVVTEPDLVRQEVSTMTFLDPAVGCASFLVVIYQQLRRLQFSTLESLGLGQNQSDHSVLLSQFYGIEINEEAALVARLALAITEHQMNVEAAVKFGVDIVSSSSPIITVGNALTVDWEDVIAPTDCSFIVGNPPFRGALKMPKEQKLDMQLVGKKFGIKTWNSLDLVAAWFIKAAAFIGGRVETNELFDLWESNDAAKAGNPAIEEKYVTIPTKAAFVSTNSVSQGSHIPNLWSWMFERDMEIGFAYPSFKWSNEASGKASVTVVIVAFGLSGSFATKQIISGAESRIVEHINGGLTPLNVAAVEAVRGRVLSPGIPSADLGNLPRGKSFIVDKRERQSLVSEYPFLERWLPLFIGADELTKGTEQYCMWLVDAPAEVLDHPAIKARIDDIRVQRAASTKKETRKAAEKSDLFDEIRQPTERYLAIPTSSSAGRAYIPMKFLEPTTIASNALKTISGATNYHFGVLSSSMHMAWMRNTSARLGGGNDYSYSVASTYNTFPWIEGGAGEEYILKAAHDVLGARDENKSIPLGKMYSTMPQNLEEAHAALNSSVDAAYGYSGEDTDEARFEFLYSIYSSRLMTK
jgi:hypothetical protein